MSSQFIFKEQTLPWFPSHLQVPVFAAKTPVPTEYS